MAGRSRQADVPPGSSSRSGAIRRPRAAVPRSSRRRPPGRRTSTAAGTAPPRSPQPTRRHGEHIDPPSVGQVEPHGEPRRDVSVLPHFPRGTYGYRPIRPEVIGKFLKGHFEHTTQRMRVITYDAKASTAGARTAPVGPAPHRSTLPSCRARCNAGATSDLLSEGVPPCCMSPSSAPGRAGSTPPRALSSRIRRCASTSWTGCRARTAVRYGVAPDTRRSSRCRTTCAPSWSTNGSDSSAGSRSDRAGCRRPAARAHTRWSTASAPRPTGTSASRRGTAGSWSATEFVSWYSAHPDSLTDGFVLGARTAVVIGVGNVAVDVTRPVPPGARAQPHRHAAGGTGRAGRQQGGRGPHGGRRGPSQARLPPRNCASSAACPTPRWSWRGRACARPGLRRPTGLPAPSGAMSRCCAGGRRTAAGCPAPDPAALLPAPGRTARRRRPGGGRTLRADAARRTGRRHGQRAVRGHRGPAGARSVGYRGVPLEGLPFETATGTVPHRAGRVLRDGEVSPGEYVAGWIKRGPTGVIGTNRPCAKETVTSLLEDAPVSCGARSPRTRCRPWRRTGSPLSTGRGGGDRAGRGGARGVAGPVRGEAPGLAVPPGRGARRRALKRRYAAAATGASRTGSSGPRSRP